MHSKIEYTSADINVINKKCRSIVRSERWLQVSEALLVPLEASIPPTAYRAPTVDFLGLVRGLWNMGRRSGSRWYFMASISSFWHSRSSENILLFSRSARSCGAYGPRLRDVVAEHKHVGLHRLMAFFGVFHN